MDLNEYTNGHDLMNCLSLALEEAVSNKKNTGSILGEDLEKAFSIAYRLSDFEKTALYQSLFEWQNKHKYFKVLQ